VFSGFDLESAARMPRCIVRLGTGETLGTRFLSLFAENPVRGGAGRTEFGRI